MIPWAVLAAGIATYDIAVVELNQRRAARGLPPKHQTLSGHARQLDTHPALRAAAATVGLLIVDHLVGTRKLWK